eukprot:ctg_603.g277
MRLLRGQRTCRVRSEDRGSSAHEKALRYASIERFGLRRCCRGRWERHGGGERGYRRGASGGEWRGRWGSDSTSPVLVVERHWGRNGPAGTAGHTSRSRGCVCRDAGTVAMFMDVCQRVAVSHQLSRRHQPGGVRVFQGCPIQPLPLAATGRYPPRAVRDGAAAGIRVGRAVRRPRPTWRRHRGLPVQLAVGARARGAAALYARRARRRAPCTRTLRLGGRVGQGAARTRLPVRYRRVDRAAVRRGRPQRAERDAVRRVASAATSGPSRGAVHDRC